MFLPRPRQQQSRGLYALGAASSTVAAAGLLTLSCSGTPEGTIAIVTGEEADTMSRAPAPVKLVTEKVALDGTRTPISTVDLPADTVDLGELRRAEIGALAVTGLDATGAPVVRGETLLVQWGALETTPLEIFVQRTGELARVPRGPAALEAANVTMVVGRYVLEASGTSAILYDLLGLRTLTNQPKLPRNARSVVTVGTAALVIDEEGATTLDLSTGQTLPLDPLPGGTFAEVAGGARVGATDGTQLVVGATRTSGGPTARVLVIDRDAKASFASLGGPREGACATWVEGRGLVVVGGDATLAGAEVLAPGATVATPLPFPPDAVRGCGAATLDQSHVAIAGGATAEVGAPVRVLDLTCTTACAPTAWPDALPLVRAEAIALGEGALFVLGDDAVGTTHAYRVSPNGAREVPLKNPRRGARLVATPTNAVAVVGGGAPGIELYRE